MSTISYIPQRLASKRQDGFHIWV